jgi:peroxiredoxin
MTVRMTARLRTRRASQSLRLLAFLAILGAALLEHVGIRVDAKAEPGSSPQSTTDLFGKAPSFDLTVPAFTDADISRFTTTLDAMLTSRPAEATSVDDARIWDVARGLQTGHLSALQEARVGLALDADAHRNPSSAALDAKIHHMLETLTIGKVAPDISGQDLTGAPFHLSDYRGKVVALVFSGEWCGICRTQYPYERLLLELYGKNWPFAILGVDSDADRDATRKSMTDRGLGYRTWWDGYLPDNTAGPIATKWDVSGWPTVYVIDATGVIRFVDLRQEDLLKGVRQLLTAPSAATTVPGHK